MKNVMNAARIIVSICVAIGIALTADVLMSVVTLDNTVLSNEYFNKIFDENITRQDIRRVFSASSENIAGYLPLDKKDRDALAEGEASPQLKELADTYKQLFRLIIDDQWFSDEISFILKGSHKYLIHESDALPVIDVRGFRNLFIKAFTYKIIADNEAAIADFDSSLATLKKFAGDIKIGGAYKEMIIGRIMGIKQLYAMNITRADAIKIIDRYENVRINDIDGRDVMTFAVRTLLEGKFAKGGTESGTNDEIDMNSLVSEIYGSDSNPVTAFREILWNLREDMIIFSGIMLILLISLLSVILKNPLRIIRYIGISLIISGLLFLVLPLADMIAGGIYAPSFTVYTITGISFDLSLIHPWITAYLSGVASFMAKTGGIAVISGIMLTGSSFIKIRRNEAKQSIAASRPSAARIIAAVLLVAAIPLSAMLYGSAISDEIDAYTGILKAADARKDEIDINRILSKALGIDSFMNIE
ncbi:MAG: hypothetical protein ACYCYI_07865 [Saccharofermentanales bacterium]